MGRCAPESARPEGSDGHESTAAIPVPRAYKQAIVTKPSPGSQRVDVDGQPRHTPDPVAGALAGPVRVKKHQMSAVSPPDDAGKPECRGSLPTAGFPDADRAAAPAPDRPASHGDSPPGCRAAARRTRHWHGAGTAEDAAPRCRSEERRG